MTKRRDGEGAGRDARGRRISFRIGETARYVAAKRPAEATNNESAAESPSLAAESEKRLREYSTWMHEQWIRNGNLDDQTVCLRATTSSLQWTTRYFLIPYVREAARRGIPANCRVVFGLIEESQTTTSSSASQYSTPPKPRCGSANVIRECDPNFDDWLRQNHCHLVTTPHLKWEENQNFRENIKAAQKLGLGPDCRTQLGLYYVQPSQPDQASDTKSGKEEAQSEQQQVSPTTGLPKEEPQEASRPAPKRQVDKQDKPSTSSIEPVVSELVRSVQRLLNALGYSVGSADGISGPRTRTAVADYQLRQGLPVTAAVTESLVAHLENSVQVRREEAIARARERQERQEVARLPKQSVPDPEYVGSGTGFVVNSLGYAVTNAHVVESCGFLTATLPDRTRVKVIVVAYDQQNDLAAVKLDRAPASWAKFRIGSPIRAGDEVVAFGFPLSGLLASGGVVTKGSVNALAGIRNDARVYQITVPVQPGNSGGPLLDIKGNVVGIISSKLDALAVADVTGDIPQNVNFAIKATLAQVFLNSNSITYETEKGDAGLSVADVGDLAKSFSVRLDCFK